MKAWLEEAGHASWIQPSDIKAQYRSASILKNRRVVFNIKGNDYRLIVAIAYKLQIVYVKWHDLPAPHGDLREGETALILAVRYQREAGC